MKWKKVSQYPLPPDTYKTRRFLIKLPDGKINFTDGPSIYNAFDGAEWCEFNPEEIESAEEEFKSLDGGKNFVKMNPHLKDEIESSDDELNVITKKREIEFRGLTKLGRWLYGSLIIESDGTHLIYEDGKAFEVDKKTVGPWTGLLDCKGVKIFEDDLCQYFKDDLLLVEWHRSDAQFKLNRLNGIKEYLRFDCDVEIIGNIFEHSHLLEEK